MPLIAKDPSSNSSTMVDVYQDLGKGDIARHPRQYGLGAAIKGVPYRGRWEEMPEGVAFVVRGYGECMNRYRKLRLAMLEAQQGKRMTVKSSTRTDGMPWYSSKI